MGIPNPNLVYLQALDGTIWVPGVGNSTRANTTLMTPPPGMSAIPWYELNDAVTGQTWRLCVQPCPTVPMGPQGELHSDLTVYNPNAPTQLLVTAPNGIIYFLQLSSGRLQSGLATPASASCNTAISVLAQNVMQRLEEDLPPDGPVFWNLQYEVYTAIVEAMNELMLLVGRPTMTVQAQLNLASNTVWQSLPKGLIAISDIYGPSSLLRKVTLFDLDYTQFGSGSDWECDTADAPVRWFPIGLNLFGIHPAANSSFQATVNAVQYPVAAPFPYSGSEVIPFQHEFHVALELYACTYLRLKELGAEFQTSLSMLGEFYKIAERMSQIQDRRDSLVFSRTFGVPAGVNPIQRR